MRRKRRSFDKIKSRAKASTTRHEAKKKSRENEKDEDEEEEEEGILCSFSLHMTLTHHIRSDKHYSLFMDFVDGCRWVFTVHCLAAESEIVPLDALVDHRVFVLVRDE